MGGGCGGGGERERWMWKDSMYGAFCIIIHNAVTHLGLGVIQPNSTKTDFSGEDLQYFH